MKPAFKTVCTLIALVAVLAAQGGLLAGPVVEYIAEGPCCQGKCPVRCCVQPGDSAPAHPLPAVPVNTSAGHWQATLIPELVELINGDTTTPASLPSPRSPAGSFARVPLFLRTHSLLI